MKVKYREDPSAWLKSTLFSLLGLFILTSVLRWRHFLGTAVWSGVLAALVCLGISAWVRPQYFRGYYRFSTWAGFWSSQCVARVLLVMMFVALIVPAGLILRLFGKDPLRLKRSPTAQSYWRPVKQGGSLDRQF